MKRILLSFIILALGLVSAQAKSLLITLSDGTEVYYQLGGEKNPVMTFEDGNVVVNTDKYTFKQIKKFVISAQDDPSGLKETFFVKGSQTIEIYSLDGKKLEVVNNKADGFTAVSTSDLPKGVYVVKVGNQSMKVIKK